MRVGARVEVEFMCLGVRNGNGDEGEEEGGEVRIPGQAVLL
jgi:hypothetical protein